VEAELASKAVAEGSGAGFGDGEAAGGDDEDGRAKFGGIGLYGKFGGAADFGDVGVQKDLDGGGTAFGFEQANDL
jgi:hypothetical protein